MAHNNIGNTLYSYPEKLQYKVLKTLNHLTQPEKLG